MKKIYVILLSVFSIFFIIGCNNQEKLKSVANFVFEDNVLTWDFYKGTEDFLIHVNGEELIRDIAYLELKAEGDYEISVVARGEGYLQSEETVYFLTIDYDQNAIITLNLTGDILNWTAVEAATHYFLIINQDITRVEDTNYNLINSLPSEYTIYVYAVFPDGSKTINSNVISQ